MSAWLIASILFLKNFQHLNSGVWFGPDGVIEIHIGGVNHSLLINEKTRRHRQTPGIITVESRQIQFEYVFVDPAQTVRQGKGHPVCARHLVAAVT